MSHPLINQHSGQRPGKTNLDYAYIGARHQRAIYRKAQWRHLLGEMLTALGFVGFLAAASVLLFLTQV